MTSFSKIFSAALFSAALVACACLSSTVAFGQSEAVSGDTHSTGYQSKLVVDLRDASTAAGSAGVRCDGSTDDTAAIQAYFNYYGRGGGGAGQMVQLQFPAATCNISRELVFEGSNSLGIRILGQGGWGGGIPGTNLSWTGPSFGTMMTMLACNNCSVENIDFTANGKAQVGLWWDASNTVTQVVYNIAAWSRASNIVTVTTTGAHVVTDARQVQVAGALGGTLAPNGKFHVLYANDNTHISFIQPGTDETGTASTGTITNYQSNPSNNIGMTRVKVSNIKGVTSTVSTVTGTNPYTFTTTTGHFAMRGATIIYRGASDASYNCAYRVTSVTTSTILVAVPTAGLGCAISNAGATGGTLVSDAAGIKVAHLDNQTEQVSQIKGSSIFIQGDQLGGSINCFEADNNGNVKNFEWDNIITNGCRYGFNGFASGNFNVFGYNGGLVTPDAGLTLAAVDFVANEGAITIQGAEIETTNGRFLVNTNPATSITLNGISWQSSCATDDQCVVFSGSLTMTGSTWNNNRISTSTPYFACGNPLFGTSTCSFVSLGNKYANAAVGGGASAPGWVPFEDIGFNVFQSAGFYQNKTTNVTSIGDTGSTANTVFSGTQKALNTVLPRLTVSSDCFSSTSPAVCGSATSGSAALAAAATTEIVNTTAVTANSTVVLTRDNSLGTKLGVTCNTQSSLVLGTLYGSARTAATSFTAALDVAPTTNPVCFNWEIIGSD